MRLTCFVGLILCVVSTVQANAFAAERDINSVQSELSLEAYAKYKMGQYDEARDIWLKLADKNDTSAFINLANLYEQGEGDKRDLKQSIAWLQKAADADDVRGQYQLGMAYKKGLGVKRDLQQAAFWLEKAAEQGHGVAQFNLGEMLATNFGKGVMTSPKEQRDKAVYWLIMAKDVENAKELLALLATLDAS
jgi:TPR repeat protein